MTTLKAPLGFETKRWNSLIWMVIPQITILGIRPTTVSETVCRVVRVTPL